MTINEAIEKHYQYFISFAKNTDTIVTDGWSRDDVVHDMFMMAMRKYGDQDAPEQELFDYLQRTIATQLKLIAKKHNKHEVLVENIGKYESKHYDTPEYM